MYVRFGRLQTVPVLKGLMHFVLSQMSLYVIKSIIKSSSLSQILLRSIDVSIIDIMNVSYLLK